MSDERKSENFESLLESTSRVDEGSADNIEWKPWKKPKKEDMDSPEASKEKAVASQTAGIKKKAGVEEDATDEGCGDPHKKEKKADKE